MKLPFAEPDRPDLERRLRSSASSFAPAPPPALRGRILEALRRARAAEEAEETEEAAVELVPVAARRAERRLSERRGTWIAAAAAVLVLASAWWLTRERGVRPPERSVVALSRELLGAGTRALTLPAQAEVNLRLEAERLLADTTRVAEGLVRGLPAPLRSRLEGM